MLLRLLQSITTWIIFINNFCNVIREAKKKKMRSTFLQHSFKFFNRSLFDYYLFPFENEFKMKLNKMDDFCCGRHSSDKL